jgi:hypothetical protein
MEYTPDMKLPQFMVLRLRGLHNGKFFANNNQKSMANYEYTHILYAFKICRMKILDWFKTNERKFQDEQHKFNSAMVFVEKEINDVVIRIKKAKKSNEKAKALDTSNIEHESAEYKKEEKRENKYLADLW